MKRKKKRARSTTDRARRVPKKSSAKRKGTRAKKTKPKTKPKKSASKSKPKPRKRAKRSTKKRTKKLTRVAKRQSKQTKRAAKKSKKVAKKAAKRQKRATKKAVKATKKQVKRAAKKKPARRPAKKPTRRPSKKKAALKKKPERLRPVKSRPKAALKPEKGPGKQKRGKLYIAMGMRAPGVGQYRAFAREGLPFTYYHRANLAGTAQAHMFTIRDKLGEAIKEPHEFVVRLRSTFKGFKAMKELLEQHKQEMIAEGYPCTYRIYQNSDKTVDGELKIPTQGNFRQTVLTFGEVMNFPAFVTVD
jgi:hypothetical protein